MVLLSEEFDPFTYKIVRKGDSNTFNIIVDKKATKTTFKGILIEPARKVKWHEVDEKNFK